MKKFLIFFIGLLVFPMCVFAVNYTTTNFDETLTEEGIDHDFSNYRETGDQVIIYLFRGHGCGYCRNFLTFLNSIVDDYGKYFRVVSFEVWNDSLNSSLMDEVAEFTNSAADGVPFIVIGDQVFPGFNNSFEDAVKEAIVSQYNSKNRYDVFEEMEKERKAEENKGKIQFILIIVCNLLFVISATVIIITYINNKHNELIIEIKKLKKELVSKSK